MSAAGGARARVFHGWVVVAAAHVILLVGFGFGYAYGAFFESVQKEFAAERGATSLVYSVASFCFFALGIVSGALADRFGPRRIALSGMACLGLGLVAASLAQSMWVFAACYVVALGGGMGFAYVPSVAAVQPWFLRRRGMASALTMAGVGMGTLIMPPLAGWLIAAGGWRFAFRVFAAIALTLGVAAALQIDKSPARRGQYPDNDPPDDTEAAAHAAARAQGGLGLRDALRTRAFWLFAFALGLNTAATSVTMVHLAPYAQDQGLSHAQGATLLGLVGVGSVAGRFLLAGLADRVDRRNALPALLAAVALADLLWLNCTGFAMLGVFAVLFGVLYGSVIAMNPAVVAELFGQRALASVMGAAYMINALGTLFGPAFAGFAYDATGSYRTPILAGVVLQLIAMACALMMRGEPRRH